MREKQVGGWLEIGRVEPFPAVKERIVLKFEVYSGQNWGKIEKLSATEGGFPIYIYTTNVLDLF